LELFRSWHVAHFCNIHLTSISYCCWNIRRKVLKCWKFDEKREIPCNFEVNPITHFGVISLFSSNFQHFNTFRPLFQKLLEINVKFKLQKGRKVLTCWKFDEKREITPKWVTGFTSKLHGRQILTCWTCLQFKLNIYCLACQDLLTMQFWSKSCNSFWSYFPFFIKFSTF
jgi:hypothetical protein